MKAIDKKIEQFALYLQRQNNLDHIQFLKVKLGLQVVVSNLAKTIVTYGVALIFHTFLYTLFTHVSYFLVRRYAHGAHAKSSLLCHVQNLIFFVALPWVVVYINLNVGIIYLASVVAFVLIVLFAPSATKKQPIPLHLVKRKKLYSVILAMVLITISVVLPVPFKELIVLGIFLESLTLLPIFYSEEDN
ncbi:MULTISPECIES: accessory gene regulator AgrB [Staphylococcus]|uniref:accessory gene regulator AgrB n=1 Tax=unclassified Staphylococcus TaxID=91994 RepID=UPI0008A88FCC|nr:MULTISPECIES: accessory gene regulator AgrB [unclassified Staphylococcus]OHR83713.1 histidine kinase [Staphylococcus sp. HMSC34C02]